MPQVLFVLCAFLISIAGHAQRLPDVARPEHYSLLLTPNLEKATFSGDESIAVTLTVPANTITLNAAEIKFDSVTAETSGKVLPAKVTLDPQKEEATFHFDESLPAGLVTLHVKYTGLLNDQLRGFYLSKTAKRNYAVTQFEPTDARRAFPCFDEPAYKATFDVTLIVPKGDTAISNTNIVSDVPGPGAAVHTVKFATTPKMSTYLVAFLVGDFQCLSGESDGVPIRACATPDKVQLGAFALSAAEYFLKYYDNYFGIKYPMPKLDMIALPDFEAGAMENFGAITYRETAMLVDPKTAPVAAQKLVAVDVAHEMAHQWFGDMVTMRWWDNLWLNEGFATWMEYKPVAAWKPEWKVPQEVASNLNQTLNLDARRVTRTIRAQAETPSEINEMFDGISYGKAGAVLLMVENYLGEAAFRKGVHQYLSAHMYGNATAEDFWNAQTEVSGKPVDRIMESLVTQPGVPLLSFAPQQGGKVEVKQSRFFLNPKTKPADTDEVWTLPVCFKTNDGRQDCEILNRPAQTLGAPAAPIFYGNAGGKGYYRSRYDNADYEKLRSQFETALDPVERITLLGSEWALTRAGEEPINRFLTLADASRRDSSPYVIQQVVSAVSIIDQQLAFTSEEQQRLAAWVRNTFRQGLNRLGPSSSEDSPETKELRAELFALLGSIGDDPQVIAQAKEISGQYLENPASVDATLAVAALHVAAQNGDAAFFDRLQRVSQTADNPQVHNQALFALTQFRDPALIERALDYAVSGKVRNQDSARLIARELNDRYTQDVAWQYIQQHWPKVKAQLTIATGGYLVQSAGGFCTAERAGEVRSFFNEHPVPASARALGRAEDSIDDCIELRAAQELHLNQWLSTEAQTGPRASAAGSR